MKKLLKLGIAVCTVATAMAPLTVSAAEVKATYQYSSNKKIAAGENCNSETLKKKLNELLINVKNTNWNHAIINGNCPISPEKPLPDNNGCEDNTEDNTNNDANNNGSGGNGSNDANNNGSGGNGSNDANNNGSGGNGSTDDNNNGTGDNVENEENNSELSYSKQVVALVNKERAKEGLSELRIDTKVEAAAQVRAKEIQSSFSHTRPNGSNFATALKESGASYRGAGENIAWGQKTPEAVVEGWMNSPGHRQNIMNEKFTSIGVGNVQNGSGTQYWAQLFTY